MVPLIIGFDVNGWNVYRALRQESLSPVIIDDRPDSIFWKCKHARLIYAEHLSGPAIIETLNVLAQTGQRFLLISALEGTISTLNSTRENIHPNIQLCFPSPEALTVMLDKKLFYFAARKLHCKILPMYFLGERWQVCNEDQAIRFPCILKTRTKIYVKGMAKAYRIENARQLHNTLAAISQFPDLKPEDIVIQEWVPGTDADIIFCLQHYDANGNVVMSFVGRKIRQWPPETGGTASATVVRDEEALAESTRFFQSFQMRGLCSMEFKRSALDGKLYMIEPTACRADYQEGVAVANGFNLPYSLYRSSINGSVYHPRPVRRPVTWLHVGSDYQSARRYLQSGTLSFPELLQSWRGPRYYAVFDWKNPEPFFELMRRKMANRFGRLWKRN